ncbi:MAG TPA: hypothetical protein GXX30_02915 [Firmicutes bacterium]|nr:hypothetical protein [Candidatus Fermentithermobacillaceae bacterium]
MAAFKGEAVCKKILDYVVFSDSYVDNARPTFLTNPETGQPLEIDRFYREGVGYEYNGDQHYGSTKKYPDEQAYRELRKRDLLKLGLSVEQQFMLITVTKSDLTLETMLQKIPPQLTKIPVDLDSPYSRMLERAGRGCSGKSRDRSR